jgi:hypothetical protein
MCMQIFISGQVHLNKQGAFKFLGLQKHTKLSKCIKLRPSVGQKLEYAPVIHHHQILNISMNIQEPTSKCKLKNQKTCLGLEKQENFTFITRNGFSIPSVRKQLSNLACPCKSVHSTISLEICFKPLK